MEQPVEEFALGAAKVPETKSERISLTPSSGFKSWLAEHRISIAFNTYNIGKLFMMGVDELGHLTFSDASFQRSMGLSFYGGTLWMAGQKQIWRFENFLDKGQTSGGHDAIFVPVGASTTGMINLHDVRATASGVYFASCNFNCIGKLHDKWSFEPIWKPEFINGLNYGDRCHLNCIALEKDRPRYVTCFAITDQPLGWRELPRDQASGVVIDMLTNEVICENLDMPHSPQLHQGTLYIANSGRGEFGSVDVETGQYTPICEVPGFTRGISFWKNYAILGSSKPRKHGVFEGDDATPLNRRLQESNEQPACQVSVINLKTGQCEHTLTIDGPASEIYDVCVLPGIQRPLVLDFDSPQIETTFRPSRLNI